MNFDFLKDLVNLNPIKTTYVSNSLRNNFMFIVDDHIKEKEFDYLCVTLLDKLHKIFKLFLKDQLDKNLVYNLFGIKLDLTNKQFLYLYEKIKQDVGIINLLNKMCKILDTHPQPDTLKLQLLNIIDNNDGFTNLGSFLLRECNNAAKILKE